MFKVNGIIEMNGFVSLTIIIIHTSRRRVRGTYFKSMLEMANYDTESQGSKGDIHKSTGFVMGPSGKPMIKNLKIGSL